MTNKFTHKQSWPAAKARIEKNLAKVQAKLQKKAANGCHLAADTLAALANVNRITTPANQ